jgi:hypothetical protein
MHHGLGPARCSPGWRWLGFWSLRGGRGHTHGRSAPRSPCWRPGAANVIDHGRGMFERCTERARRVLFFARYEASQLSSASIDAAHLLLGLIREGEGVTSGIFAESHLSLEGIRKQPEDERRSLARSAFQDICHHRRPTRAAGRLHFGVLRRGELTGQKGCRPAIPERDTVVAGHFRDTGE